MSEATDRTACPEAVRAYAAQTVRYVQSALGLELEYDSDTLPLLDHYLTTVPAESALLLLTATTAGAYFGEVIRRQLGGRWDLSTGDPATWRFVLPTGMSFAPAGVVARAIARSDDVELASSFDAPPKLRPYLQDTLSNMGEVSVDEYYSLCGRFDTLEHLHAVLLGIAVELAKQKDDGPN